MDPQTHFTGWQKQDQSEPAASHGLDDLAGTQAQIFAVATSDDLYPDRDDQPGRWRPSRPGSPITAIAVCVVARPIRA